MILFGKQPDSRWRDYMSVGSVMLLTLSVVGSPSRAPGQDLQPVVAQRSLINDVAASHPLSAYIDRSTIAVAEMDWENLDVDALFAWAADLTWRGASRPAESPEEAAMVKRLLEPLRAAGVGKIYLVFSMRAVGSGVPVVVIPVDEPTKLAAELNPMLGQSVIVAPGGDAVLVGEPNQINRYARFVPAARDELLEPLTDAKRMNHTVVFALPELTRNLLGGIWPVEVVSELPLEIAPGELIKEIQRVTGTFRAPPDPSLRLKIELLNEASAQSLAAEIKRFLKRESKVVSGIPIECRGQTLILSVDVATWQELRRSLSAARRRSQERELSFKLRELGLAFYQYADREKHLPPRCFVDPNGKPLHGWIVALLPDLEQKALYGRMRLDREWNAAGNEMLEQTALPGICGPGLKPGFTTLRAPVFPGSIWEGDGPPRKLDDLGDRRGETILLIDAPDEAAIHWADPTPWIISERSIMKDVFGDREDAWALMADGAVRRLIREELDEAKLKSLLTLDGDD